jgi:hypothetical protein
MEAKETFGDASRDDSYQVAWFYQGNRGEQWL